MSAEELEVLPAPPHSAENPGRRIPSFPVPERPQKPPSGALLRAPLVGLRRGWSVRFPSLTLRGK